MKTGFTRLTSLITITLSLSLLLITGNVGAVGGGSGYKVSPVRTDLIINRGTYKNTKIYVKNVSSVKEYIQTIVNDFTASKNESGTPTLILNEKTPYRHGLKQFVTIKNPKFILTPGQQETVNVDINIPKYAAPGGYYGAIRFAPASLNSNQKSVNLSASVATLVLVKVPGNYYENMTLSGFNVEQNGNLGSLFYNNKNIQANVSFTNEGEVQEEPFGKILLTKAGKQIYSYPINTATPPGNVLPNSTRKFTVDVSHVGIFGKYTLMGNFGYGSKGQLLSATTTFYVIPIYLIVIVAIILLLIILVILLLIRKKRHSVNK